MLVAIGSGRLLSITACDNSKAEAACNQYCLKEVTHELERWYGVAIRIPDPALADRRVTISFEKSPLEEVLEVITVSLDARFEEDAEGIALLPGPTTR